MRYKKDEKPTIYIVSKLSPNKILTYNKEKNSNFTVEKPTRHQVDLHQVIEVDILRDGQTNTMYLVV